MTFALEYLHETSAVAAAMDPDAIERLVESLRAVRDRGGRVFVLGLGGSAANASHCVNDLRVRGNIQAYTPEIAEWTARANDEGWEVALARYLRGLTTLDAVVILSGSGESAPLRRAATMARAHGAWVFGVLGTAGSPIGKLCDVEVLIPEVNACHRAGHAEAFQAVVWHACVAHPRLAV